MCKFVYKFNIYFQDFKGRWTFERFSNWVRDEHLMESVLVFSAAPKQLYEWFSSSVHLSVRSSVCRHTRFTMFPARIIMKFSGVITNDRSNVHEKVNIRSQRSRSQRSKPYLAIYGHTHIHMMMKLGKKLDYDSILKSPGPRLNIKTVLSTYGDFHVKDKTAVRTSYL